MEINEMIEKLLAELGQLVRTESVVGKPIQTGDTTVIPVSKISSHDLTPKPTRASLNVRIGFGYFAKSSIAILGHANSINTSIL